LADKRRSGVLAAHGPWIALIDEKRGMIYYRDEASNVTTWNRPASFPFIKLSAAKRKELQEQNRRYLEWRKEGVSVKKVNVLGRGVVTAKEIGSELDSLNEIRKDIDARLRQVGKVAIYKEDVWAAYLDDASGLVYYYNEVTKNSVWDAPSEVFLERVKERMMEDSKSFVGGILGDDVTREVFREVVVDSSESNDEGVLGDDVTREVVREQVVVNDATDSDVVEIAVEKSTFFMQEMEDGLARSLVDYDAAVRLAFEASGSVGDFDAFKTKYLSVTSAMVAKKHEERTENALQVANELKVAQEEKLEEERRLSRSLVDYDAAVRLAYEASGSVGDFDAFKTEYLSDASKVVADKFAARLEARKKPVIAESTLEFDTKMPQATESPSNPFFFLDDEENTKSNSETLEQREEPILQFESSEPSTVDNEISINLETEPPMTTEVFEAQPKVPQEDPFANGSNVKSLISPLKTQTLYDILQCDISSTRSEIKRSYLALAKETHPDALLQNGVTNDQDTDKRFNEIARAYKILSDPTERRRYNRELKAKGLSRSAGNVFENWVMGAAKAMDVALTKAEMDLESRRSKENS
jgi:hypothetical protein